MMKLSDIPKKKPKILIYGKAGVGKTAFTLTLGEQLQTLDLDDGVNTGQSLQDEFKSERLKVDIVQCLEESPVKSVGFGKAKAQLMKVANSCNKGDYAFKWLGIDSYTGLADAAVRFVLSNSGVLGKGPPKIQHWGLAFNELEGFLAILRSLPIGVVMVCHEQTTYIDEVAHIEIATPGQKLQAKIPRFFDEVWYMKMKHMSQNKTARVLQTQPTPSILARSRSCLENETDTSVGFVEILKKL